VETLDSHLPTLIQTIPTLHFIHTHQFNLISPTHRLFEVCQFLERDGKLLILLVFEYMEQDLSDLIEGLPKAGMSPTTIQVES